MPLVSAIAVLLCLTSGGTSARVQVITPPVIQSSVERATAPIWVSADAATTQQGQLRSEVFETRYYEALQRYAERTAERRRMRETTAAPASNGCESYVGERPNDWPDGKSPSTLDELVRSSNAIYEGKVSAIVPGFFDGQPSSLLRVEVTNALKSSPAYDPAAGLYVPYAAANFTIGTTRFCARPMYSDHEPRLGDRVLIFALHPPADDRGRLLHIESGDLLFASADGKLSIPKRFRNDLTVRELRSLAGALDRTRSILRETVVREKQKQ